jgi:hypothetical protein
VVDFVVYEEKNTTTMSISILPIGRIARDGEAVFGG